MALVVASVVWTGCFDPEPGGRTCGPEQECPEGYQCDLTTNMCLDACPPGYATCNGACVNLDRDNGHCGACDNVCEAGELCNGEGACELTCQDGFSECAGACFDLTNNDDHCGACGIVCPAGQTCNGDGTCAIECADGFVECNGACIDPRLDERYCGAEGECTGAAAGVECAEGERCQSGACVPSCLAGQVYCTSEGENGETFGRCIDPNTDREFCGAYDDCEGPLEVGVPCEEGAICNGAGQCALSCQSGLDICNGTCVDLAADRANCGACDNVCEAGKLCNGSGVCELSCQQNLVACDGVCIDPMSDERYCSAELECGMPCAAGELCNGEGACALNCADGFIECGGKCIDPTSDRANCGTCGIACDDGYVCSDSACALSCQSGLDMCGDDDDATCVNVMTDRANCGDCGIECADGYVCDGSGQCALSCQEELVKCGSQCIDPATNREHCGAFGDCNNDPNDGVDGALGDECGGDQVCSPDGCVLDCPGALVNCDGACIDPATNREHCGAFGDCNDQSNDGVEGSSGDECTGDLVCGPDGCVLDCPGNLVNCGGACIDPASNRTFCGAYGDCNDNPDDGVDGSNGAICGAGEICQGAAGCVGTCPEGQRLCGSRCVNSLRDNYACGPLDAACEDLVDCGAGQVCNGVGACATQCGSGLLACDGSCINPTTSLEYCGASGDCISDPGEPCEPGERCDGDACVPSCPFGLSACDGECINPLSDERFCGVEGDCAPNNRGVECEEYASCVGGVCAAFVCPIGSVFCASAGRCVDPRTDSSFCGINADCQGGGICGDGEICDGTGFCRASCQPGFVECNGVCIDPNTDNTFCGASDCESGEVGTVCGPGERCDGQGNCAASCASGFLRCGDRCIDPLTDERQCSVVANCSGVTCDVSDVCVLGQCEAGCSPGEVQCGAECIDPNTDARYCGAAADCVDSGTECPPEAPVCNGEGVCATECADGYQQCGDACVDILSDPQRCGDCDAVCEVGAVCVDGACECPPGLILCDGACVDIATGPATCGALLANLVVVGVTEQELGFDPDQLSYAVDVPISQTTVSVLASPLDPEASVEVNGTPVAGNVFVSVELDGLGEHDITVRVFGAGGGTRLYRLTVHRTDEAFQAAYQNASDASSSDEFGAAIAMSGDTLVVGVPEAGTGGAVYVFRRQTGVWQQDARLPAPVANAEFGASVALDGNVLVVGAPGESVTTSEAGAVYVFYRVFGTWITAARLISDNPDFRERFGVSVAIHGNHLAVGAPFNDIGGSDAGAVYMFAATSGAWTLVGTVNSAEPDSSDHFGASVALRGDVLAVSAPDEDSGATGIGGDPTESGGTDSGAVYVFTRDGDTWGSPVYIKASNTDRDDAFGTSVALADTPLGMRLAVGAPGEDSDATGVGGDQADGSENESGAVYLFVRINGNWLQEVYIKASNTESGDRFGSSVALSANDRDPAFLLVGAPGEDSAATGLGGDQGNGATQSGAAYLFLLGETGWGQSAYVKASNTEGNDEFGSSVAVGANGFASGAPGEDGDDNDVTNSGAVYIFR
ncbi:cadherin-like beta sandwich domain-containing protein [Haliangium ochraceum]|uniref:Integrin alpha beta-propellor repeat protein n=1 Tax=Haliangium ochraceum (strain DSM 14365 / JCM 11303 / SMP-2) TaxID=502025 RepID=D0LVU8_HALO1|nr:cadherin-like beta sandwich domain-containing protein [Haliangium ochraceum]ACY14082.1 Integrin alpha beta-propellor repeat protein [Haliangium ochraceum DSM 14365]